MEIREIVLLNEQITSINPYEVMAFKIAGGGAMGEPGEINIFIKGKDKLTVAHCNYVYGNFDIDCFMERMADIGKADFVACLNSGIIPERWAHVYLGMGNSLYMREEYFQKVKDKYADMLNSDIYELYYRDITELMVTGKLTDTQNMKEKEYRELCHYVKRAYKELEAYNVKMHAGTDMTYMRGYDLCDEINLWTYWQGRGVYNPKIMLIGQDWGCPFVHAGDGLEVRLKASKDQPIKPEDDRECLYFQNMQINKIDFKTDENLAELFQSLNFGYDDLLHVRYDDLFFTNICLGYRNSGNSGNFRKSWITDVEKYAYPKLVKILQPEIIICLGLNTYESFLLAMGKKDDRKKSPFNNFIDTNNKNPFELDGTPVFVFAHCGAMGTLNRNDKLNTSLEVQKRDWQHLLKFLNI